MFWVRAARYQRAQQRLEQMMAAAFGMADKDGRQKMIRQVQSELEGYNPALGQEAEQQRAAQRKALWEPFWRKDKGDV